MFFLGNYYRIFIYKFNTDKDYSRNILIKALYIYMCNIYLIEFNLVSYKKIIQRPLW